jgi:hypothetical protein
LSRDRLPDLAQRGEFRRLLGRRLEESGVLDGDPRLGGQRQQQIHVPLFECSRFAGCGGDLVQQAERTKKRLTLEEGNDQSRDRADRHLRGEPGILREVRDQDRHRLLPCQRRQRFLRHDEFRRRRLLKTEHLIEGARRGVHQPQDGGARP